MYCLICGSPASICIAGLPHQESRCLCQEHATPEAIALLQQAVVQNKAMLAGLCSMPPANPVFEDFTGIELSEPAPMATSQAEDS